MAGFFSLCPRVIRRGVFGTKESTTCHRSGNVLVHLAAWGVAAAGLCIVCVVRKGVLIGGVHLCLRFRTLVAVGVIEWELDRI